MEIGYKATKSSGFDRERTHMQGIRRMRELPWLVMTAFGSGSADQEKELRQYSIDFIYLKYRRLRKPVIWTSHFV